MEYIGEHLLPGQLGRFFVSLAFAAALISAFANLFYLLKKDEHYKKLARASFMVHAISIFSIVGVLFFLMSSHYFEYDYIWKHSSLELPTRYIFSAFWEGQEGSFILWMFWHAVLGLILMYSSKKLEASAMMVFSLVQAFLLSMILGIYIGDIGIGSSPFVLMRNARENIGLPWTEVQDYLQKFPVFMDGRGLNPLLQNYWMTIHPPTLFLGFASVLPPFALAIAGLISRDYSSWVKPSIPWAYFSVMIFGTGILMGGAWAYEALSFGGFWAWDPVENSSLVPWLTMVGAAHLLLVRRNSQSGLRSSYFMMILSFVLVLYSTFLTRSGVLGDSSVHSFVDLGLNGQLLIYLLFFSITAFGLFFYHAPKMKKSASEEELSSKEFWMFIGSLILLISAFQIILLTSVPVYNQLIGPDSYLSLLDEDWAPPLDPIEAYQKYQLPFAIVITFLIAITQFLSFKRTSAAKFKKRLYSSLALSIIVTGIFATIYKFWMHPAYLSLLFAGVFATVSNFSYWLLVGKGKLPFTGSSIAHIGFAFVMIGALIANGKQEIVSNTNIRLSDELPSSENSVLYLNDTTDLYQYHAIWTGTRDSGLGIQYYDVEYYDTLPGKKEKLFSLEPYIQKSDEMGTSANPSTKHYWNKDVYTHVVYSSLLEAKSEDGYGNEMEVKMERGDTAIYQQHFVILDSIKVNARFKDDSDQIERLRIEVKLVLINILGEEFVARPVYYIEGESAGFEDAYLEIQKFKFRLAGIDTDEPDSKKLLIKAFSEIQDDRDFIIMKAIIFPLINLLWLGCILMALGTGIAIWQRIKA